MEVLTKWKRLYVENQDHSDFQETLSMEIHDPLWAMARQWQAGEFNAENSGSPIFAQIHGRATMPSKIGIGDKKIKYDGLRSPLEAFVETCGKEPDLQTRMEMGRHWTRLINHIKPPKIKTIQKISLLKFPFELPSSKTVVEKLENAHLLTNEKYMNLLKLAIKTSMIDGWKIYLALNSKSVNNILDLGSAGSNPQLVQLKRMFVKWYETKFSQQKESLGQAWDSGRNEYNFTLEFDGNSEPDKLIASEYYQSKLDWFAFDEKISEETETPLVENIVQTVIPSMVTYPGMPVSRLWEFENRFINFSSLEARITSLPVLSLIQFGLVYGNDWFTMPLGNLPDGCKINLSHIVVTDSFGFRTKVKHYSDIDKSDNWSYFSLSNHLDFENSQNPNTKEIKANSAFLLPSSTIQNIESRPVEMINFLRDEMANLAWGIEKILPDQILNGKDGDETVSAIRSYYNELRSDFNVNKNDIENDAQIQYLLTTEVPYNWIPFSPVKILGTPGNGHPKYIQDIKLRRSAMPRIVVEGDETIVNKVRPLSPLLRIDFKKNQPTKPLELYEEEIPRSGTYVRGSWQRTRWYDGEVILWYGYSKTNGKGEGNSGLKFDSISPK